MDAFIDDAAEPSGQPFRIPWGAPDRGLAELATAAFRVILRTTHHCESMTGRHLDIPFVSLSVLYGGLDFFIRVPFPRTHLVPLTLGHNAPVVN